MFSELSPFDVMCVVKACRKDSHIRQEWAKKHGFLYPDGSTGGTVGDLLDAEMADPCLDNNRIEELEKLSTQALEELQTLMYLGRDGIGDSDNKVPRHKAWGEALKSYDHINKGDRNALIHKIHEKSPLEFYLKDGLSHLTLQANWKTLFFQLESRPQQSISEDDSDEY